MTDDTYDFVDADLPKKREAKRLIIEQAEEGTLFGVTDYPKKSEGERLSDFDRERLQESGHLPEDEGVEFDSPDPEEVLTENSTADELAGESEPLGKLCADPEQMEEVEYGPPKGYSDKVGGSYQQRGFISRCLNWLGGLF